MRIFWIVPVVVLSACAPTYGDYRPSGPNGDAKFAADLEACKKQHGDGANNPAATAMFGVVGGALGVLSLGRGGSLAEDIATIDSSGAEEERKAVNACLVERGHDATMLKQQLYKDSTPAHCIGCD